MNLAIVIPAFNEALIIGEVLKSLPRKLTGISTIQMVVVDDGSSDSTKKAALGNNVVVLTHSLNRGVGAATKTGIEYAKLKKANIVITFDADGQHNPNDIQKIIRPIIAGKADIVIGSRFKKMQRIPLDRLVLNWFANIFTLLAFGVLSTDSQSGLRALSNKAIQLIDTKTDRMEFSSELIMEAKKNNLRIIEIPSSAIYTKYSRAKGQKNLNAFSIVARLLVKLLR